MACSVDFLFVTYIQFEENSNRRSHISFFFYMIFFLIGVQLTTLELYSVVFISAVR